jgi:mannose-6-phosphate isomerase-like protein (cupin superfamily)
MDPRFDLIQSHPANQVFQVVFFPDRVYHAQYLNATRSPRYRYNIQEVRSKSDATVLKGEVYLDDARVTNFLRVEYRGGRLVEVSRQKNRLLQDGLVAWVKLLPESPLPEAETYLKLGYCPWVDAYQAEVWETLEPPAGARHDIKVLDLMGRQGNITRVSAFSPLLREIGKVRRLQLAFRENFTHEPFGYSLSNEEAAWDNFYDRNLQVPNTNNPSDAANTVPVKNYEIDFRRGFYVANVKNVAPVRYRNAMMIDGDARAFQDNIIEMRWVLQQELGTNLVFFHEVTIPPGTVEGTHQHIGSEELYFITEGRGFAYLGANDDPAVAANAQYPTVTVPIFGLDPRPMKQVPVEPGSVIFTKSGGMHGIENSSSAGPLKFVAFLYHAT